MTKVILDPSLRASLNNLDHQLELCDEANRTLGFYLPAEVYKKLLASLPIPFTQEEMERRRQETGGRPLAEIWKTLGRR